jgi:hypothetical protein
MSSTIGLSHGRYIRLMAISAVEILGTIPLGTFYLVHNSKLGVTPWRGWAFTHEHYSKVIQVPAAIWKNNPNSVLGLEMYRWSLVLCAFLFFALFGFANEARQNYRRLYTSIASRIGYSTSTLLGSSNAYVFYLLCVFGLDSLGLIFSFFLSFQYFISSLREEKRRRKFFCGYNEWRQAHIKHLIFRPISDAVYFTPSRR